MKKLILTFILATGVSAVSAAPAPAPWNLGYGPTAQQASQLNKRAVPSEETANYLTQRDIMSITIAEQIDEAHRKPQQPTPTYTKYGR